MMEQQIDWGQVWFLGFCAICLAVLSLFGFVAKEWVRLDRKGDDEQEDMTHHRQREHDHRVRTEVGLLGAIMQDFGGDVMGGVFNLIDQDSFIDPRHKIIFAAMMENPQNLDIVCLVHALAQKAQLDEIGGVNYLVNLIECAGRPASMLEYAKWQMPCKRR